MDKELINSKIEDLEAELQKLKQLANEPEQRTPEAGDVLESNGRDWMLMKDGHMVLLEDGHRTTHEASAYPDRDTYLGKFDEVYVKISDVRDALSHEDYDGESILKSRPLNDNPYGLATSREALRQLNITND
jgi:hypothetical protein